MLTVLFLGPLVTLPAATASLESSRVVDRTLRGSTTLGGHPTVLTAFASAGARDLESRSRWKVLAHTWFHAGSSNESALVGVGAGSPQPRNVSSGFWIATTRCRASTEVVRFDDRALRTGAGTETGATYACEVPPAIVMRVRAVFRSAPRLHRVGVGTIGSSTPVKEGLVAARMPNGKPLVLAAVFESGSARLHVSRTCVRT